MIRVEREFTRHCMACGRQAPTYYLSFGGQKVRTCAGCFAGIQHLIRRADLEDLDSVETPL